MKRILASALLLAVLAPVHSAEADVMHEFGYQLKDVKKYGAFTVVFKLRIYDTSGAVPPPLRSGFLRLPRGAALRRDFLKGRFVCDVKKLDETKDPRVCKHAEIGRGTVLVDARPLLTEGVPANIFLFLARATEKRAVASIAILGLPDLNAQVVRDNPWIQPYQVVLRANIYNEPTSDGRFGYKLVLPTGPIRGVEVSVAEVNVTLPGLTLTKRRQACVRRRAGRCTRRRAEVKKLYWFTIPRCPSSNAYPFEAVFTHADNPPLTHEISIPCPPQFG
jgi:hypothetical protein